MIERDNIEKQIREQLTTETSGILLSNKLFSPDGLFNQLAHTEDERRIVSQSPSSARRRSASRNCSGRRRPSLPAWSSRPRHSEQGRSSSSRSSATRSPEAFGPKGEGSSPLTAAV